MINPTTMRHIKGTGSDIRTARDLINTYTKFGKNY